MPATVISPQCGFARNRSEAEYPRLWPSAGAWSPCLDARGGTILRDRSGRGNHGTLTTMDPATDWVTSGGYSALDFDGTSDYVNCGNNTVFDFGAGDWSIYWRGIVNSTAARYMLVAKDVATGRSWAFSANESVNGAYQAGTLCMAQLNGADGFTRAATSAITAGQVASFCATKTAGVTRLYKNGLELATSTNVFGSGADNMTIGTTATSVRLSSREYVGAEDYLPGVVHDCLVHRSAWTPGEVNQLDRLGPGGWATTRRRRVAVAAAAPPATFQSAWARGSNVLITPGAI